MRVIVRPAAEPQREIDLTRRLVSAIAEELWRRYGGNDVLNWAEAERHLAQIVGEARAKAPTTAVITARSAPISAAPDGVPAADGPLACPGCPRRRASARLSRRPASIPQPAIVSVAGAA